MPLNLKSVANGSVILNPASTATDKTITLPATDGTMLVQDGTNTTTITNLAYTGTLTGGTGVINIGSGQVYKDASGNVGIGTASPDAKLEVIGTYKQKAADGNSQGFTISINGATDDVLLSNYYNAAMRFETNNTERMRLDAAGNLGLGVTPSAWNTFTALQVKDISLASFTNGDTRLSSNAFYQSGWKYINTRPAVQYLQDSANGVHAWFTAPSGTAGNAITFVQDMTLTTGGNLSIGKTTASESPTSGSGFGFAAATVDPFLSIVNVNASGGNTPLYISRRTTGALVQFYSNNGTTNTSVGLISYSGTTTTYGTSSDYRLKEVSGALTDSGKFIDALEPVVGTWKADGSPFVGFLAHKFQEVSPSSVLGEKDAVDKEGNPVYQSMQASSSEVIANIIAELQSLRKRVAELEAA